MSPPRPHFDWLGLALSLLILVVVGWAAAGTPFRGDQALYTEYARRMSEGAVLYRDLWEVTNPGVFWFYQLAGTCFGFTEDGIHLFEWLYWVAFVQTAAFATKRAHSLTRWPLAPAVLVGGVYYLTSCSDPSHLTKAEGLVAFPLFLSAWLACLAVERPRPNAWLLLAAGLAGGVAVLFKFAFAACVFAGWLPPACHVIRRGGWFRLLGLVVGAAAPLVATAVYFQVHGAFDDALRDLFVTPREVLRHAEFTGFDRLANSLRWFVEVYSGVLAAALAGTLVSLVRRVDPLVVSLGLTVLMAVPVILVQRWSWWSYHFLLLAVPASVLAAYTWPVLLRAATERLTRPLSRTELWGAIVVGLAVFLPVLGHGGSAHLRLLPHRFGITAADRQAARTGSGRAYAEAIRETAWLREPTARHGPVFVAGDPLFHMLSGRAMATGMHGWSLELLTPELWQRLLEQLRTTRPVYVYVDGGVHRYDRLIAERCPAVQNWLALEYAAVRRSAAGVWYERKPAAE